MQLVLDRLTKQYGTKIALDRIDAVFQPGIYGLLGANGAGKTTLLRLICDILKPTLGEARLNGKNIGELGEKYRAVLGYLPQEFGFYPNFTATDFLLYMASLKGLNKGYAREKAAGLLETVGLKKEQGKKIKTFSGGMKQRLGIAQALLNDPEILILDEPTAGLDPKERVRFRNFIRAYGENKIVILSTHIVTDVEHIADEILILKDGSLVKKGTENSIISEIAGCVWECRVTKQEAIHLENTFTVCNSKSEDEKIVVRVISDQKPWKTATPVPPCLEDLYMHYFHGEGQ